MNDRFGEISKCRKLDEFCTSYPRFQVDDDDDIEEVFQSIGPFIGRGYSPLVIGDDDENGRINRIVTDDGAREEVAEAANNGSCQIGNYSALDSSDASDTSGDSDASDFGVLGVSDSSEVEDRRGLYSRFAAADDLDSGGNQLEWV